MAAREGQWSLEAVGDVAKKDLTAYLQENGTLEFLTRHKLNGKLPNIAKARSKEELVAAYADLVQTQCWASEADREADRAAQQMSRATLEENKQEEVAAPAAAAAPERKQFTLSTMKKGDKTNFPKKGDFVKIEYHGFLEDGTEFDTSWDSKKRRHNPLRFKMGAGKAIRGLEEALRIMSVGEKARITIESEWAYGKKGMPEAKIPPNANLVFEVELVAID
eukprot:GILJ01002999.1.p1 GENE.GILJ01002999.1~~GILJ01002999.1.p1  ORF type:complete len:233 (-),score=46.36 GILJ01002999.1:28-690(-)